MLFNTSLFMQIQQKDNETLAAYIHHLTLAAYIHHFKAAPKQCTFDNDTVAICIFDKGLWDAHTTRAKIFEQDPQTLADVIRLVEKCNAAVQ